MANKGKFTDRSPNIIPAGVPYSAPQNMKADVFTRISLDDKVTAMKREAGVHEPPFEYPLPRTSDWRYSGIYTQMRDIVTPIVKSVAENALEELKETSYNSYWKKPLGLTSDPTPNVPPKLDLKATTFGKKTEINISARDLVNPPKPPGLILAENDIDKKLYKFSQPGEQMTRNYEGPHYKPFLTFGIPTPCHRSGRSVRRCITWFSANKSTLDGTRRANFYERTKPKLATSQNTNKYLGTILPEDFTFGLNVEHDMYGVAELIHTQPRPFKKEDQLEYLRNINSLRKRLKYRFPEFPFDTFHEELQAEDKNCMDWIPLDTVLKMCHKYNVHSNEKLLIELLNVTGIMTPNGCVNYTKFVELLSWKYTFPDLPKVQDTPPDSQHYLTSSNAAACSMMESDISGQRTAGLPSARYDLPFPRTIIRADGESLGDETAVSALINPSIYSQYGASHREFLQPRTKEQIHEIFCNIGVEFSSDVFENIWQEAYCLDKTGGVCVETFRNILDEHAVENMRCSTTTQQAKRALNVSTTYYNV